MTTRPLDAPDADSMIGTRVGGYVVIKKLGQGGMGAVYVAEHPRLRKKAAVKVLLPEWSGNVAIVQRFIAEALAASAIDHPHIVSVIDEAQLPDGRHYIVLEYLEGKPLDEYIHDPNRGPLPIEDILVILAQIALGLEAAHQIGIVHRDLKPPNVFITSEPGMALFVKVLDFGIAKLGDKLAGEIKTGTFAVFGTPAYMPPEQARGAHNVDSRADIYALGVIAYEMLTRTQPYQPSSPGDLIHLQLTTRPPDPRSYRADVPDGWPAEIARAMALDVNVRPRTVREFVMRLMETMPDGLRTIRQGVPKFLDAPPDVETVKNPASQPLGQPPTLPGTPLAMQSHASHPTTLGAAAAQTFDEPPAPSVDAPGRPPRTVALPAASRRRGARRWLIAAIGAAVIVPAAIIGARSLGQDDGGSAANHDTPARTLADEPSVAPTEEPPRSREPAPLPQAAPATVDITIETTPEGAILTVNGAPHGPAPITLPIQDGAKMAIRAAREGYLPADVRRTASAAEPLIKIELAPEKAEPVRPTPKPSRPGRGEPTRPPERPFDPNAPGGV